MQKWNKCPDCPCRFDQEDFPHLCFLSWFFNCYSEAFCVRWFPEAPFTQKSKQQSSGKEFLDGSCVSSLKWGKWIYSLYRSGCWLLPNLVSARCSSPHFPWKSGLKLLEGKKSWVEKWMNWDKWVCNGWRPELDVGVSCGAWLNPPLNACVCSEVSKHKLIYGYYEHEAGLTHRRITNRQSESGEGGKVWINYNF